MNKQTTKKIEWRSLIFTDRPNCVELAKCLTNLEAEDFKIIYECPVYTEVVYKVIVDNINKEGEQ